LDGLGSYIGEEESAELEEEAVLIIREGSCFITPQGVFQVLEAHVHFI
jgi:tellurite resistance-related uncharacterized protein